MNDEEFMELALRVTEGTATPGERARFEEELGRDRRRREDWLALRRELASAGEAFDAVAALEGAAEAMPADRLDGLMRRNVSEAGRRHRTGWLVAGMSAAAVVALVFWPATDRSPAPADTASDGARLAFVVPRDGAVTIESPAGTRVAELPVPLTGVESIRVPDGAEALLLSGDGAVSVLRGSFHAQVLVRKAAGPGRRWFAAPLALLVPGPAVTRGGGDIRVHAPRGATAAVEPAVVWESEAGRTYEVELRDALQPSLPPARVQGAVSPLAFGALRSEPLSRGGIYLLSITETGRRTSTVIERFLVVPPAEHTVDESGPAGVVAAAFRALVESPARTGDAWQLLQRLPPAWRESELGRRLEMAVEDR